MTKKLIKRKTLLLLISIIFIGVFLRANHLTTQPRLGATFDEFAWTWVGMSLIQEKVPSSWSPHPQYEGYRYHKTYLNANFWIVKPYLEHPPFFGLVTGSFAMINGAHGFFDVTLDKIRPLALILGVLSMLMLFLLVKEIYDEKTALISTLLYATIPTIVIGSRLVQNENFFIPLFLFSLLLIVRFIKNKDPKYRNLAALICGLLIISKVPWVAASISISAILMYKHKYKDLSKFLTIVLVFFLAYLVYGLYFNSDLFISLWKLQLQRYDITFNSVYALFTEPYLADRFMIDGWIYFGWIAFFLLLIKDFKKNYLVIFSLLGYLGVFIFAIPNEAGHGWYRYPFYPFLCISLALFIKEYFNRNILLTFLFILFIGLSLLELTWSKQFGFSFKIFRVFLFSSGIVLLPIFFKNKSLQKFSGFYSNLMLAFIFGLNFWAVMEFTDQ